MARIVIVAGTDAGQEVAAALSAAGHEIVRTDSLSSESLSQGDVVFIEPWLYTGSVPADVPVVILASGESVPAALEAVKNGAYDLLRVPCTREEIRFAADRALRYHQLVTENDRLRRQAAIAGGISSDIEAGGEGAAADKADPDSVAAAARNLAGKPLADIEKQVILRTLEQFKGHRLRTAAALGIGVRTLGMKIKRWREEGEPIAGRHHSHQQHRPVHVDVS